MVGGGGVLFIGVEEVNKVQKSKRLKQFYEIGLEWFSSFAVSLRRLARDRPALVGTKCSNLQATMLPAILSALLLLHSASVTAKSKSHRPVGGCGASSGPDIDHASAIVYITQANKWIVSGACDGRG